MTDRAIVLRQAGLEDESKIFALLVEVAATSPYTGGAVLNPVHLRQRLQQLLASPDAMFLTAEDGQQAVGLLVLLMTEDLISGERFAAEVCWYVSPGYRDGIGVLLLAHGELAAKWRGAVKVQLLAPAQKFDGALARRGYTSTTRVFERRF